MALTRFQMLHRLQWRSFAEFVVADNRARTGALNPESGEIMKRFYFLSALAVVGFISVAAGVASGQSLNPRPFALGVYAGGSKPTGDFSSDVDLGYHVGAFGSTALSGAFSVRLDGAYSDFGKKDINVTDAVASFGTKMLHGTLDGQYDLGAQSEIEAGGGSIPYISAGAGFYRLSYDDQCAGTQCAFQGAQKSSETRWGLNIGAGANFFLSGFTPFVDIHYHTIFAKRSEELTANMLVASFGLKF